jgi:hypothetical protein
MFFSNGTSTNELSSVSFRHSVRFQELKKTKKPFGKRNVRKVESVAPEFRHTPKKNAIEEE